MPYREYLLHGCPIRVPVLYASSRTAFKCYKTIGHLDLRIELSATMSHWKISTTLPDEVWGTVKRECDQTVTSSRQILPLQPATSYTYSLIEEAFKCQLGAFYYAAIQAHENEIETANPRGHL